VSAAPTYATREEWLGAAIEALRPTFDEIGQALPVKLRATCGWPTRGAISRKRRVIGECIAPTCSADGTTEVCVSPALAAPGDVLPVLVHELVHASGIMTHRGKFMPTCKRLGLDGKPTATVPGEDFAERYGPTLAALGAYPHAAIALQAKAAAERQSTRMLKCSCNRCGYTVRTSRKWVKIGLPSCVCGGGPMVCRDPIDVPGEEGAA
jgi:hypothetical protein